MEVAVIPILSHLELTSRDEDQFIHQIKNATTAVDVFNIMNIPGRPLQTPELVSSMKSLFELQKLGMSVSYKSLQYTGLYCSMVPFQIQRLGYCESSGIRGVVQEAANEMPQHGIQ